MSESPKIVTKRAIDITPELHGIWCSIGDGEPFVNPIVSRRWSEDGEHIWFMLDSHNFVKAEPNEEVDVVERVPKYMTEEQLARALREDARCMASRPRKEHCPSCGQEVKA